VDGAAEGLDVEDAVVAAEGGAQGGGGEIAADGEDGAWDVGALEGGRGVQRDELAVDHEADAVAVLGFVEVVGGDEDGRAGADELADEAPEGAAGGRVDARGGLVEEDEGRLVDEGAGEGEALADAAREVAGEDVLAVGEAGDVEGVGDAGLLSGAAQAVGAGEEGEVFDDLQVGVEREALGHVADGGLDAGGLAGDREAGDAGVAGARGQQAAEHADGGGLARAVGAEVAEDLAAGDVKRDGVDGGEVAEAAGEVGDLDDGVGRLRHRGRLRGPGGRRRRRGRGRRPRTRGGWARR
jgi:hypothetical protein